MLPSTTPHPPTRSSPPTTTVRLPSCSLRIGTRPRTSGLCSLRLFAPHRINCSRNGRWRCTYLFSPSASTLSGTINVDVHYFEDGNVRLTAAKEVSLTASGGGAVDVLRQLATAEKRYQEELNRGFAALNEGAFKSLRRQLPVTRQKVEWEKIGGYRLGQDIGGGRAR